MQPSTNHPKTQNHNKGSKAEDMAVEHLVSKGYTIEHRNWRGYKYEIDIIASINNTIVFVEVKSRKDNSFGWPEKAVTRTKINHISKAANEFLQLYPTENELRFDIVSITQIGQEKEIYHIEDAFVP